MPELENKSRWAFLTNNLEVKLIVAYVVVVLIVVIFGGNTLCKCSISIDIKPSKQENSP